MLEEGLKCELFVCLYRGKGKERREDNEREMSRSKT